MRKTLYRLSLCFLFCIIASLSIFKPSHAEASLSMTQVNISAQIQEDGSLVVHEERVFSSSKRANGVFWEIPLDSGKELNLRQVGIIDKEGRSLSFTENPFAQKGDVGVYSLEQEGGQYRIKLFSPLRSDEEQRFYLDYSISGAVSAYSDVAELYWKFVGDAWEASSENVKLSVSFASSQAQDPQTFKPAETVHAYGHGVLSGEIKFEDNNSIIYTVPEIDPGEFAEARILFPLSFVSQMQASSQAAYQRILDEEKAWAEKSNALREQQKHYEYLISIASLVLSIVVALICFVMWFKHGKDYKPIFKDKYLREIPSQLHPALLGRIWRGKSNTQDLSASIVRLANLNMIDIERITKTRSSFFGDKIEEDYLIKRKHSHEDFSHKGLSKSFPQLSDLDISCYQLLFNGIVNKGEDAFYFSEIKTLTKDHPQNYLEKYEAFHDSIERLYKNKRFIEPQGQHRQVIAIILCIISILFVIYSFDYSFSLNFVSNTQEAIFTVLKLFALAISIICMLFMRRASRDAEELYAQLKALKNWFEDFTLLKEAPPTHVKVWKELIVMAIVLGVAHKVIEQLKLYAPQILEDPEIGPIGSLFSGHAHGLYYLDSSLNEAYHSSHELSQEMLRDLADSSSSSLFGGGGGFSIGGGGGFGGGGGGTF